jgi:hypothetical protein
MVEIVEADGEAVDLVVADLAAVVVVDLADSAAVVQVAAVLLEDGSV